MDVPASVCAGDPTTTSFPSASVRVRFSPIGHEVLHEVLHGSRAGTSSQKERQLPRGKVPLSFPLGRASAVPPAVRGGGAGRGREGRGRPVPAVRLGAGAGPVAGLPVRTAAVRARRPARGPGGAPVPAGPVRGRVRGRVFGGVLGEVLAGVFAGMAVAGGSGGQSDDEDGDAPRRVRPGQTREEERETAAGRAGPRVPAGRLCARGPSGGRPAAGVPCGTAHGGRHVGGDAGRARVGREGRDRGRRLGGGLADVRPDHRRLVRERTYTHARILVGAAGGCVPARAT